MSRSFQSETTYLNREYVASPAVEETCTGTPSDGPGMTVVKKKNPAVAGFSVQTAPEQALLSMVEDLAEEQLGSL